MSRRILSRNQASRRWISFAVIAMRHGGVGVWTRWVTAKKAWASTARMVAPTGDDVAPILAAARIVDPVTLYCEAWHSSALRR